MAEREGISIDIGYIGLSLVAGLAAYLAARAKLKQALAARQVTAVPGGVGARVRMRHLCGREWEIWMQEKGYREDGNQEE